MFKHASIKRGLIGGAVSDWVQVREPDDSKGRLGTREYGIVSEESDDASLPNKRLLQTRKG